MIQFYFLQEIRGDEVFNLPCRLIKSFDEPNDVTSLWVEDGTKCPLLTLVNIDAFDSQNTQLISTESEFICVKAPKRLLPEGGIIEDGDEHPLLYLRWVRPKAEGDGDNLICYQFEVTGSVELLSKVSSEPTRVRTALVERLKKMGPRQRFQQTPPPQVHSTSSDSPTRPTIPHQQVPASPVPSPPTAAVPSPTSGMIPSSGESATVKAMLEMVMPDADDDVDADEVLEDIADEERRLEELVMEDEDDGSQPFLLRNALRTVQSLPPAFRLDSQDVLSFSQAVTSTQKDVAERPAGSPEMNESSSEEEVPNGQRFPADSSHSSSSNSDSSPHPPFRAANEVLNIRTAVQQLDINQVNVTINSSSLISSPDMDRFVSAEVEVQVSRKRRHHSSGETSPKSRPEKCPRQSDSNVSIKVEEEDDEEEEATPPSCSQESDGSSVIALTQPVTLEEQVRLYGMLQQQERNGVSLSEVNDIPPDQLFRITTRITQGSISPVPRGGSPLEGILVAVCRECRHMWDYCHFKVILKKKKNPSPLFHPSLIQIFCFLFQDSISEKVRRPRKPSKAANKRSEFQVIATDKSNAIVNHLGTTKAEHDVLMRSLRESPTILQDVKLLDYDFNEFIDCSFDYICPACKRLGKPDSLIPLEPTFFLRLHVIGLDDPTPVDDDDDDDEEMQSADKCNGLHIMACGVHAEYLLGTRAEHVLRSDVIWKKAESRLKRLVDEGQPLTLVLRKLPENPREIHLEHTFVVYGARHVLPFPY